MTKIEPHSLFIVQRDAPVRNIQSTEYNKKQSILNINICIDICIDNTINKNGIHRKDDNLLLYNQSNYQRLPRWQKN